MPLPTVVDRLLAWPRGYFRAGGWFVHRLVMSAASAIGCPRGLLNPSQAIEPDVFPRAIVEAVSAKGQPLRAVADTALREYWAGIRFQRNAGVHLEGGVSSGPFTDSLVIGY